MTIQISSRAPLVSDALISHRGAPKLAPENTLPGFREAARLGAKWLEVDVKLTSDLRAVIIHDRSVDRTTNGTGFVAGMTFEEMRALDAGSWFHPKFAGTRVPTLEELIETVLELDIGLQLEFKPTPGDDVETAEISAAILKSMWPANRDRLFVSSLSVQSIKTAHRLLPNVPRVLAVTVPPRNPKALLREMDCQALQCKALLSEGDALKRLVDSGIEYAVAVVNDPDEALRHLSNGAQSVLTDIPDLLNAHAHVVNI